MSLVELMVALVLGLIVTGSALTLAVTNRLTFTATENLSRVQESARISFELMGRDLRSAGGNPCDSRIPVFNGLVDPGGNWWSNWADLEGTPPGIAIDSAPGLRGYSGTTAFPDVGFGTATGQRVAGTDAIETKAAVPLSADVAVLTTDMPQLPADDLTVSSTAGVAVGDLLLICNYVNASLFQVTGISASKIQHTQGSADWENASASLPQEQTSADGSRNFNAGAVISRVSASRWYVGNNGRDTDGDGVADGRSLYRALFVNDGGKPGVSIDEVALGITDMEVTYLVQGSVDYVDASTIGNWSDVGSPVIAVRVELTLEGGDRVGPGGERLQRTLVQTVAVRGRAG